jgi:hypothetical protein
MADRVFSFELNQMLDSFSDLLLADPFDRQLLELVPPLMKNQRLAGILLEKIAAKNHSKSSTVSAIFSKWLNNIDENLIYLMVLLSLTSKKRLRSMIVEQGKI